MLGKVLNINPTGSYQGNSKRQGKGRPLKTVFRVFNQNHDSSDISAASNFLRKTNWNINHLNQTEENLHLDFTLDQFRVITDIDLRDLKNLTRLLYTVHQLNKEDEIKNAFVAVVSLDVIEKPKVGYEPVFKLDTINLFFNRINDMKISSDISRYDNSIINILLEGIVNSLYTEFKLFNFAIIEFVRVLTTQEIGGLENSDEFREALIIEKIYNLRKS